MWESSPDGDHGVDGVETLLRPGVKIILLPSNSGFETQVLAKKKKKKSHLALDTVSERPAKSVHTL